jgi:hypothetical protein
MNRNRTIKSYTMKLNGTPDVVFPLLCPVREYEWIETWQCEMIYTKSGFAELDCIFKTNFPYEGPEEIWVVSKYEPPHLIEFARTNSLKSNRYSIELVPQNNGLTKAAWQQIITGLNDAGDIFVTEYQDEAYKKRMQRLEKMLNYFLDTGKMLKGE